MQEEVIAFLPPSISISSSYFFKTTTTTTQSNRINKIIETMTIYITLVYHIQKEKEDKRSVNIRN